MIVHALIVSLIIIFLSYLYGKIAKRFVKVFEKVNCTAFGFFVMLALFQVVTFIGMFFESSYVLYGKTLYALIALPIVLIILFRVNIIPDKEDLYSFLFGTIFTFTLFMISKQYNTNNTYYDSIFYLSKVLESSFQDKMGHVSSYSGLVLQRLDALYDYQGFYYLWGMILRKYREIMQVTYSTSPIYLWGASFVYYYIMGSTVASITRYFFRNKGKIFYLFVLLMAIPYSVNYFNTVLGFFGNTLRPIYAALLLFCIYLFYENRNRKVLYLAFFINLGGIAITSSSLFIGLFMLVALGILLVAENDVDFRDYRAVLFSMVPLLFYASIALSGWEYNMPMVGKLILVLIPVLFVILECLIRCSSEKINILLVSGLKICFIMLLVVLIGLSGYLGFNLDFYFALRSKNDMLLNLQGFENLYELLRNIMFYILIIFMIFSKDTFKKYLGIYTLFFLNPLTMSAIMKFFTSEAYHRLFDTWLNPFVLIFMIYILYSYFTNKKYITYILLSVFSITSVYVGYNVVNSYSNLLIPQDSDYNYECKTSESLQDMYKYINENIKRSNEDRPMFLSQDFNLKGYVANISVKVTSVDYRDALDSEYDENDLRQQLVNYFYPFRVYSDDSPFGVTPDYQNIASIIPEDIDYILLKNDIPLLTNGEYTYTWWPIRGCGEIVYQNDHWALLRVY